MILGNAFAPIVFNIDEEFILGCTDNIACNFDNNANFDDGSCEYAQEYYDCENNCLLDSDQDGICDQLEILGCTDELALNFDSDATDDDGSCIYTGCTDEAACNYDENATADNGSCEYPEENYDCDGNCIADIDCNGVCNGVFSIDECGQCVDNGQCEDSDLDNTCDCIDDCVGQIDDCGICNGPGFNDVGCCGDEIQDCNSVCGGDALVDECGVCDENTLNDCTQDCLGNWGGSAVYDLSLIHI